MLIVAFWHWVGVEPNVNENAAASEGASVAVAANSADDDLNMAV